MGVFAKFIANDKFTEALTRDCLAFVESVLNSDADPEMRSAV